MDLARLAEEARARCLEAAARFDRAIYSPALWSPSREWWQDTFENHPDALAAEVALLIKKATWGNSGCLTLPTPRQKVTFRGRRQRAYQLVAWGLAGELPSEFDVVRHLCNNERCIHPDHLRVGTQAENVTDQYFHAADQVRKHKGPSDC